MFLDFVFPFCQSSETRNLCLSSGDVWLGVFVLFSFLDSRAFEIGIFFKGLLCMCYDHGMTYGCVRACVCVCVLYLFGTYIRYLYNHCSICVFGSQTV